RLNIIGNDGGNQSSGVDLVVQNPPYPWKLIGSPAIYYRWWMKIMPGFSWGTNTAKAKSSRIGDSTGPSYTGYILANGFVIGECDVSGCTTNTGGSAANDTSIIIPYDFRSKADGVWHEYIVKVKANTSATCTAPTNCDAQFQAWVDGVSVGQYNNFKLNNNASRGFVEFWGGWMTGPYFQLNATS